MSEIKTFLDFPNILTYDVEVFKHHWSVSLKDYHTGQRFFFEQSSDSATQGYASTQLKELLDSRKWVLVGFNNTFYDNHILGLILNGYSNSEIKELNDYIIEHNEPAWTWTKYPKRYFFPYAYTDLMDDLGERMSLKMYEANKGMNIVESGVDFTLDRPLTEQEKDINKRYNEIDVDATEELLRDRLRYLNTKLELGTHAGLNPYRAVQMTNAKLVASYLVGDKPPRTDWGDEYDYNIPENIRVSNQDIVNYFKNVDKSTPKYDIMIAGVPHTLSDGGLHGSQDKTIHVTDHIWQVQLADGDQYYPSMIVNYKFQSRNMDNPELYDDSVRQRGIYKANKDPRQEPFKLVNNTAYGATNNKYNALNDPLMANSTCFTGQLLLIDLIEKLQSALGEDFELIQSNTDGIMYKYRKTRQADLDVVTKEWEERVMIKLDFENIDKIVQSNVNNYIMMDDNGNVTAKGSQMKGFFGRSWTDGHLHIIAKAMGEYFLYGTAPETTINNATDILDFQMLLRNGRTYDFGIAETPFGEQPIQRVNRVYASKDKRYGMLYKCKNDGKRDKMPSCPPHSIVDNENKLTLDDIDKQFYINLANERILNYIGGDTMSDLGKLADRITRLEKNGKVLEVKKGAYIPQDWVDANVITLKRYRDLLEEQVEEPVTEIVELTDEELDKRIDDIKAEGKEQAKEYMEKINGGKDMKVDLGKVEESKTGTTTGTPPLKEVLGLGDQIGETLDKNFRTVNPIVGEKAERLAMLKKIHELRIKIATHRWEEDGYNKNQKYGFISSNAVKAVTNKFLIDLGLELVSEITDILWIQNPGNSMHITQAKGLITLIDIETGYEMCYNSYAQGADGGDKGIYKARTGLLKYFWFDTFGIATMDDAEYDQLTESFSTNPKVKAEVVEDLTPNGAGWVPQDRVEAIKETVAQDDTPATDARKEEIRQVYMANQSSTDPKHVAFLQKINTVMASNPTETQVVELIMESDSIFG